MTKFLKDHWGSIILLIISFYTYYYNANVTTPQNEKFYLHGVFPKLRICYDHTLGKLPFAMAYIGTPILLLLIIYKIWKVTTKRTIKSAFSFLKFLLIFGLSMYIFFYWSWAFNYKNQPLKDHLSFPNIHPDSCEVYDEGMRVLQLITAMRDSISIDTQALDESYFPVDVEDKIRSSLVQILKSWELPSEGKVRVRTIRPDGILLRFSTAGIYLPFFFEGHIDNGLAYLHRPFVMAHEMAHGYGITDEGDCNFTAVLVCANSGDIFIRYSGLLMYWRYLANSLIKLAPRMGESLINARPTSIVNDVNHIRERVNAYPDLIPNYRDLIYDAYLKSHGVTSGLDSYGAVVGMMYMWKKTPHNRKIYDKIYLRQ